MQYSYLFENRYDQEGFQRAIQELIEKMGQKKFDRLYYQSKVSQVELWYLAGLLVDIFMQLSPAELEQLLADQERGKGPLAKLYKSHRGEKGSKDLEI